MDGDIVTWIATASLLTRRGQLSRLAVLQHCIRQLARLNSIAGVFEFDVDASGNTFQDLGVEVDPKRSRCRRQVLSLT
jgi:hypothetical protein